MMKLLEKHGASSRLRLCSALGQEATKQRLTPEAFTGVSLRKPNIHFFDSWIYLGQLRSITHYRKLLRAL